MKISVTSTFTIPFEQTRQLIMKPQIMQIVAWPIFRFVPIAPHQLPEFWAKNQVYRVYLYAFTIIPLGWYDIKIEVDKDNENICIGRDRGHGQFINVWNHAIIIQPQGNQTLYTDEVEVHAGLVTPFIALFAKLFYNYRQNRWKSIIIPSI